MYKSKDYINHSYGSAKDWVSFWPDYCKFLSYMVILCLIVTSISLIPTKALYPQPRIDLDEYTINVTSNTSVYVEGTVSKSYGQQISVRDTSFIPIALGEVGNSGGKESFRIKIPSAYIKSGSNLFYVYSEAVRGKLARSNSKEFKVNYNTGKQTQTITASNKSVAVGKVISLGAKASSGLPLSYKSENPSVATVDMNGKVIGRQAGSAKITISQSGNSQYGAVTKTIIITVSKTVTASSTSASSLSAPVRYQFGKIGQTISLRVKSKSKVTYKSSNKKIATVNSKGQVTAKKAGTTTITMKAGKNSAKTTIVVPKKSSRATALKPWYSAMYKQYKWSFNSRYRWKSGPTVKNSKTVGTCITFPSVSAQRVGLVGKGRVITACSDGRNTSEPISWTMRSLKSINNNYWWYSKYPNETTKALVNKGKIIPGDIVSCKNHVYVYMGKDKQGNLLYNHSGHSGSGIPGSGIGSNRASIKRPSLHNDKQKVALIVRIKTFPIVTSCLNGNVTSSSLVMAGQNKTIKYSPRKGYKISKVKVDGKTVKNKGKYTFKKLSKKHTVSVVCVKK